MKLDYQDLASFIEVIVDEASEEGLSLRTIGELYAYLDNNFDQYFTVLK